MIAWAAARREAVAPEPGEPELLGHTEQLALERLAKREPAGATRELARLVALREAVFDLVAARSRGDEVPGVVADSILDAWKEAASSAIIALSSGQFNVTWTVDGSGLALLRDRLAWQAMALVTGDELRRAHLCAGDDCGWLFLDGSKAGRRRWCDMATCGNVAKARRHYQRKREVRGAGG
ncbi:MAG: CGNR zinc finger domain-containing protein [Gemmatimonadaceae bacterium]